MVPKRLISNTTHCAALSRANTGMPDAETPDIKWDDATRWSWFALHTNDDAFKFRISVALEAKRQSGGKVAVDWSSLTEVQDGFALRWQRPSLIRGGHMWWLRLLRKIRCSPASYELILIPCFD